MLMHPRIDPVAIHLGPITVHWYGLTYLAAFGLFMWLATRRLRHPPFAHITGPGAWSRKDVEDILFLGVLGVVVGGRLGYCLFYKPGYYLTHPLELFFVWQGGMSFHGGLLGVIGSMVWFAHSRQRPFWEVADFVAPCVPTGLAAGRVGNFINGELPGRLADPSLPWGMVFRGAGELPRHPSQIYQFLMEGLLLFVLLWLYARRERRRGQVAVAFLFGYGVFRFIAEFFREPDDFLGLLSLGMSMGQWLCVPMILLGAGLWWWFGQAATGGGAREAMSKENWLSHAVDRLLPASAQPRSAQERLEARLPHQGEALSPGALRKLLAALRAIVDPQVSEVEGGQRAARLVQWHAQADEGERRDLWLLMSECFVHEPQVLREAQTRYEAAIGTPDEAAAQVRLRRETVSPRRRLLQRISAHDSGIRFLVAMRSELLRHLKTHKRLQALDVEMEYLFSTWFDVGFLELRRISWDSPASLIEKLIQYEAVHDIKSWADVKNRLDSDRRCYGFFHPSLPNEPLIFVEVALLNAIAISMAPLLDESADAVDIGRATTAIFYSISNTQAGLRGVSFGDSLIKRVVEALKGEFPRLRNFATLSPIPGLRAWLPKQLPAALDRLDKRSRAALAVAMGVDAPAAAPVLAAFEAADKLDEKSPLRKLLLQCAALYLRSTGADGRPLDAVARFHLGNGAHVESLDWGADASPKGAKQSYGIMVNYLYDLKKLDKHRQQLARGQVAVSSAIDGLAF